MIIKEYYKTRNDGVVLYRSYSDKKLQIHKIGSDEIYDEAIDVADAPYTYEETNEPIEVYSDEATDIDYQKALREMGVKV